MAGSFRRAVFVADPPHSITNNSISCGSCHVADLAAGAALTTVAGNANVC